MFIREATLADAPSINTLSNYLGYDQVSDSTALIRLSELLIASMTGYMLRKSLMTLSVGCIALKQIDWPVPAFMRSLD